MTRPLPPLLLLCLDLGCYAPEPAVDDIATTTAEGESSVGAASTSGAGPTSDSSITSAGTTADDGTQDDGPDDGDDTTGEGVDSDTTDDDSSGAAEASSDDGSTGLPLDTSRIVFLLTEAGAPMAYGGLAGADARCQQVADDAGLAGTFLAWLSATPSLSPSTRFEQGGGPFVRPDGTVIALDWPDLVDGALAAPISVTATGLEVAPSAMPESLVVTHTLPDGTFAGGIAPCQSFASDFVVGPRRGTASATDVMWTDNGDDWSCANDAGGGPSLYCFAQ